MQDTSAITDLDFEAFKRKVRAAHGIDLNAYKRQQMERRLRANMLRCGVSTFAQYYTAMQKDSALLDEFLDRITINVSELFRNPEQFELLQAQVLPRLFEQAGTLKVWSAGCSYGAEPYTLSILLDELSPTGRYKIIATDIDDRMLARAKAGIFQEHEMSNVSKSRLLKYFDRGADGYAAKSCIKDKITFRKHNLLEDRYEAGFDLILCRNVVIYFTEETKAGLYERFFESLRPGGCLFVGGTERISDHTRIGFENRMSFFYTKPQTS